MSDEVSKEPIATDLQRLWAGVPGPGTQVRARVDCPMCPAVFMIEGTVNERGTGFSIPHDSAIAVHVREAHGDGAPDADD